MLSHVSLGTNDADRAAAFYDPVLAVLGLRKICERDGSVDYGAAKTVFSLEKPSDGRPASAGNGVHIAFDAGTRAQVDTFHRVALANGGTCAGPPGLRPNTTPTTTPPSCAIPTATRSRRSPSRRSDRADARGPAGAPARRR